MIAQKIRLMRAKVGLKQAELADRAGFSLQTIGRWERNERQPRIDDLQKVAVVLGTTVACLVGEDDDKQSSDQSPNATAANGR
jgi:transcriptional regulator with XRE-family HTH domain